MLGSQKTEAEGKKRARKRSAEDKKHAKKERPRFEPGLVPAFYDSDDYIMDEAGIQDKKTGLGPRVDTFYRTRLAEKFELVYGPTPNWAVKGLEMAHEEEFRKDMEDYEKNEDGDVTLSNFMTTSNAAPLPSNVLNILKVKDLNAVARAEGQLIRSIDFHPTNPCALVAGSSSVVSLYKVDGTTNALVDTITYENFPLRHVCFSATGEEIYASSGLMGHFYCYDVTKGVLSAVKPTRMTEKETLKNLIPSPDGKYLIGLGHRGNMYLFSKKSKHIISTMSINGEVQDACFTPDGSHLIAYGDAGVVYRFDMKTYRCIENFSNSGAFGGSCVSACSQYIACGSTTGFVTVFGNQTEIVQPTQILSNNIRKPINELGNLQTPISTLKFNKNEEILAMASNHKDNAVRLIHLPSINAFRSFPFVNADYGRPNCLSFSPGSGYFAFGNNKGCAYLFRLKHYDNY